MLLAAGAAVAFVACGDSTEAKLPPHVVATADASSRGVTFDSVAIATPAVATVALRGHVFGAGPTGVVLAHMRIADQTSWFPFATQLADSGKFTVLTFDFRGFGESVGEKDFDLLPDDLEAAVRYMQDVMGVRKVFVVGASTGGTAALIVAARTPLAGVVTISAEADFLALDAVEPARRVTAPKLFIASQGDVPADRSLVMLLDAAVEPKDQRVYDGDAHGTAIFDGPHGQELTQVLLDFLTTH
jgi:pimeloyl-ACP methyl ester carboxylesterase